MNDTTLLERILEKHEGLRQKRYRDSLGVLTIGIGHNMEAHPLSEELQKELDETGALSRESCIILLKHDIMWVLKEISGQHWLWWNDLSNVRQSALGDMIFNLGMPRFLKFKAVIQALENEDYIKASDEMLDSLWASQVKGRAQELALMIRNDSTSS